MNNYQLNTNWCLWYHNINDTNWKNNSYKNIYDIRNAYDVKFLNDTIHKIHLQNSMFFIMREDIFLLGKILKIDKDVVFLLKYRIIF